MTRADPGSSPPAGSTESATDPAEVVAGAAANGPAANGPPARLSGRAAAPEVIATVTATASTVSRADPPASNRRDRRDRSVAGAPDGLVGCLRISRIAIVSRTGLPERLSRALGIPAVR